MTLLPNTYLVAQAWLQLAVPGPRVGDILPAADDALRTDGFLLPRIFPGAIGRYVPLRSPVVTVECWVAPPVGGSPQPPWNHAAQLAELVIAATYDRALANVLIDLSAVGGYALARVLTSYAVGDPQRMPNDPGGFARYDVDISLTWRAA